MARVHIIRLVVALLVTAAVAACGDEGFQLPPGETQPDDFLVYATSRFENTAKVIPSAEAGPCPRGAIVLATGQDRPGELVTRVLTDSSGEIDTTSIGTATPYPIDAAIESIATDNQIIRLADGSLLAMKNGYRWDVIEPQPDWWDAFTFDGSDRSSYERNTVYFWRSTDCGASWTRVSQIDPVKFLDGKYAWPQPLDSDEDGAQDVDSMNRLKWTIGGFDRTELYQDPWTETIYVSGHGDGGPFLDGAVIEDHHGEVIFFSTDNAATWNVMPELTQDYGPPFVMTSTPNGRFYAFSCTSGEGRLIWTETPGDPTVLIGQAVDDEGACGVDLAPEIARDIFQPSISRVSLDTASSIVRVAYPILNDYGRQEYEVVTIEVDDTAPEDSPDVTLIDTITSEDETNRSVMFASFIEPDYVDHDTPTNTAVLYWIETSIEGNSSKLCAKYKIYGDPADEASSVKFLSQAGGQPRCWTDPTPIGDYMSGGFFFTGSLNYFAQWVDAIGIHGNIVTVSP